MHTFYLKKKKRNNYYSQFQEGKTALLAANDRFLGLDEDDNVVAVSDTAGTDQMVTIRSSALRYLQLQ